ncbi:DEAD-box ATP-dependent RNA helicase 38-like [Bidens hawaiensis]|uniref:DEAD-box ATP-dependent RNA helicase 38-like n=1 Tax=Bidens hawaiensis TaxID=980011 RepID=UPI00404B33AD
MANNNVDSECKPEESAAASTSSAVDEVSLDSLIIGESSSVTVDDLEDSSIQTVTSGDTPYTSAIKFEDLNLSRELLKGLYVEMGFERPSKIQSISLPMILTPPYKSLIAQARNGSGKTTCFVLGMLSRVDPQLCAPQALCICPTRELAIQNMEVLFKMGKFTGITSELSLSVDKANYIPISKRPPVTAQVVIGTPGTINKWIAAKKLGTFSMKILVFDEADHMLAESGFKEDSVRIMKEIVKWSPNCQVLLFSATFDDAVKAFVSKIVEDLFVREYNKLFVKKEEQPLECVKQYKVHVPDELSKVMVVKDKIMDLADKVVKAIIFVHTRRSAGMLHKALVDYGFGVTTIHGGFSQKDRDTIIKEFKDGLTKVLISTDLLNRGFDDSKINLVVNYDLPVIHENPTEPDNASYLHRVGRAGRYGRKGAVFNLLCGERENMIMEKIETHFKHYATEVPSWTSDEDFMDALKKAGLV